MIDRRRWIVRVVCRLVGHAHRTGLYYEPIEYEYCGRCGQGLSCRRHVVKARQEAREQAGREGK